MQLFLPLAHNWGIRLLRLNSACGLAAAELATINGTSVNKISKMALLRRGRIALRNFTLAFSQSCRRAVGCLLSLDRQRAVSSSSSSKQRLSDWWWVCLRWHIDGSGPVTCLCVPGRPVGDRKSNMNSGYMTTP